MDLLSYTHNSSAEDQGQGNEAGADSYSLVDCLFGPLWCPCNCRVGRAFKATAGQQIHLAVAPFQMSLAAN